MIEYGLNEDVPYLPSGEIFMMWGDTVSGNIDRYVERYFQPILKHLPLNIWNWNSTKRVMKIGRATIDFRSADRPENWEGFGYHLIFLNEAGIILQDPYLYDNAVLPMLMDFPNAKLIAAGTPKGKKAKNGQHKFFQLWENGTRDKVNYRLLRYSSYDNPFIAKSEIDLLASIYDEQNRKQEIFGEFIDMTEKAFLYAFNKDKHTGPTVQANPFLPLLVSFDFNVEPMTAIIAQKPDIKTLIVFDEVSIPSGSTPEVCDIITAKYPHFKFKIDVTGDATGQNRTSMIKGNVNHYKIIKEKFELTDKQLLVPKVNPSILNSRVLCNSLLQNVKITITENCIQTIHDCTYAVVDDDGDLVKTNIEGLHKLDAFRYALESAFPHFLTKPHIYQ